MASSSIVVRRQGERVILYKGEEAGGGSKQDGEEGEGEGIEKEDVRPTRSWRSSSSHPRTRRNQ